MIFHNQLVAASNGDSASYQYDALGRRVKTTSLISNIQSQIFYFSNGWNVELEHDGSAYTRRMTWGLDLSQSPQGAGGVGGLVMVENLITNNLITNNPFFPTYDGNGNITAWVNDSGTVVARQRYDAYGNIIQQTGAAPSNYGFSTKPMDQVTGLLYYGYRYYDPVTGRWPSRDPIEEQGGVNLYEFVGNDGVCIFDIIGCFFTDGLKVIENNPTKKEINGIYLDNGNVKIQTQSQIPGGVNGPMGKILQMHETVHINQVKASKNWNAIPYKQIFAYWKNDGKCPWAYFINNGTSVVIQELKSGESEKWERLTEVFYSNERESGVSELEAYTVELAALQEKVSGRYRYDVSHRQDRIDKLNAAIGTKDKPGPIRKSSITGSQSDVPRIVAFKEAVENEKKRVGPKQWKWKDETHVYEAIK